MGQNSFMNLNEIAAMLCPYQNPAYDKELNISGVSIDSRLLKANNLFIAIKGDNFDGHDFVLEAEIKGALAVVVERFMASLNIPQFVVPNTLQALAKIATKHREGIHCPIIALTGSNGKTTVKEMIAAILPPPAHATKGNFNNQIGAPISVLSLNNQHRYAVFELGANHPKEIEATVSIVSPDVALINNIAPAHIEGFGSIDGVARAKGEIYQGLKSGSTAIVNEDDTYAHFWDDLFLDKTVLRFSAIQPADIYARNLSFCSEGCGHFSLITPQGTAEIKLQVPGLHNVRNALAAAACAIGVAIDLEHIQFGLSCFNGVRGRMTFLAGKNQSVVIDDTYNANLRSVLTALEVLSQRAGKKIFVFGDMGELGQWTEQHHREVGLAAYHLGIDMLFSCGQHSALASHAFGKGGLHFSSKTELVQNLLKELSMNMTVLVKGSRSSAMEKIVDKLLN